MPKPAFVEFENTIKAAATQLHRQTGVFPYAVQVILGECKIKSGPAEVYYESHKFVERVAFDVEVEPAEIHESEVIDGGE